MVSIIRLDPLNGLTHLDPFSDLDNFFKGLMVHPVYHGANVVPQIRLEVSEDDKAYTVTAEIPGVRKEDIHITVDGSLISINAEVKRKTEHDKKLIHSDRQYGQVSRSFTLDKEVEQVPAKTKYTDGVLEAVLPKKQGPAVTQISVS